MTENSGWGTLLGGGIVGYMLGANGGNLFGGANYPGYTGAGINCDVVANGAKLDAIMANDNHNEILNAVAGVNANVSQSAKDIYQTEIQNLLASQQTQQNLYNEFCKTREYITNDGVATRAAVDQLKDQISADKIAQLRDEVMTLKNQAATAPLYGMIGGIQNTLNSVIGCAGVRVCPCNNTPVSGTLNF